SGMIPGFTRWSPDGKSILFAREGQFVLMPAGGGDAKPLTHHATPVSAPAWAPDGSAVYFLASEPRTAEERERDRLRDDVFSYEETYKQRHLWKVTVATGGEQAITSGDFSITNYRLSRDGKRVAVERAPSPLGDDADRIEIWTFDSDGTNGRQLTTNKIHEID